MKKLLMIAVLATLASEADAETSVLRSLPNDTQKKIENIRDECRGADLKATSQDEGLSLFTLSGMQAVMIDELNFCDGGQCNHASTAPLATATGSKSTSAHETRGERHFLPLRPSPSF